MIRNLIVIAVGALVGVALGVGACAVAGAWDPDHAHGPRPWPDHALKVAVADPDWQRDTRAAVRMFNLASVDLQVRLVDISDHPDVIITTIGLDEMNRRCRVEKPNMRCLGLASTVGYRGRREMIRLAPRTLTEKAGTVGRRRLLAHEIGHVLGLNHQNRGCSIMRSEFNTHGCPESHNERVCGPTWQDVEALQRLYGKREGSYTPYCRMVSPWRTHRRLDQMLAMSRSAAQLLINSITSSKDRRVQSSRTASSAGRSGWTSRAISRRSRS